MHNPTQTLKKYAGEEKTGRVGEKAGCSTGKGAEKAGARWTEARDEDTTPLAFLLKHLAFLFSLLMKTERVASKEDVEGTQ
jgi:hypothetical protein